MVPVKVEKGIVQGTKEGIWVELPTVNSGIIIG